MTLIGKRNVTLENESPIRFHAEDASANHAPRHQVIRRRVYEIYLERNGLPGDELDDWLRPNVNSKSSPSSHETGIGFRTRLLRL